jgi:putative membrane protein
MDPQSSVVSFPFSINQWQRLSVFAVVYFFIDNLRRLINGFIYLIPALAINYSHVKDNALLLLCGVAVVNAFFSIATYKRFRFKLTQDKLIIQSGVFKREMLDLPYEKVQSVNIIQPFFFRFSGHAAAQLDSAGSVQTEAVLAALSLNDAQSIKRIVMKTAMKASDENAMPVSDDTVSSENQDQILNKRHLQDLIIHGISNNRMWLFLGFAAPFFKQISSYLEQWLSNQGLMLSQLVGEAGAAWWQFALYGLTLLTISACIVALFSVFGAILTFYNYTLIKSGNRYIRRSGLFSVQEVSIQHSRLQEVVMNQDWLDVVLKRVNFYYVQNKTGRVRADDLKSTQKVLVPSVTQQQALTLMQEAMVDNQLTSLVFRGISARYLLSRYAFRLLPAFLLSSAICYHATSLSPMIINISVFCVLTGLVYLRYKRWGIASDETFIYVKSGLIGKKVRCFERFKLQQVSLKQTIFMRAKHLSTLEFVLASGSIYIPFLHQKHAHALAQSTLQSSLSSVKSWM